MKTIFYKEKSIIISADKNDLSDCFIIQSKKIDLEKINGGLGEVISGTDKRNFGEKFGSKNIELQTPSIGSKILNVQPNFLKVIRNFSTSAYGEIYLLSYKMFIDNPITGIGINNFKF